MPRARLRLWDRTVSPERALHELSMEPWRPTLSLRVMAATARRGEEEEEEEERAS